MFNWSSVTTSQLSLYNGMACQPSFIRGHIYSASGAFVYVLLYHCGMQTKLKLLREVYMFIAYLCFLSKGFIYLHWVIFFVFEIRLVKG